MGETGFWQSVTQNALDIFKTQARVLSVASPLLHRGVVQATGGESSLGMSVNEGFKDAVRDTYFAIKLGMTASSVDANVASDEFDQWWRKNVTQNTGLGQSEFQMAAGWELPKGVKYNGRAHPEMEGHVIPRMDALFIRQKNGDVEVMDSQDPRYVEVALPYLTVAVMSPSLAGKAIGALKAATSGGKAEKAMQVIEKAGNVSSVVNASIMGGYVGKELYSGLVLNPAAIKRVGRMVDSVHLHSQDHLREELNGIYEEYQHKQGMMAAQYYIKPIPEGSDPIKRLQEMSSARIEGIKRVTPFDRIADDAPAEILPLVQVREQVEQDPYFQRGVFRLFDKALNGKDLSQDEQAILRFSANVLNRDDIPLVNAGGKPLDLQETVSFVKAGFELEALDHGVEISDIRAYVSQKYKDLDTQITSAEMAQQKSYQAMMLAP